MTTTKPKGSLDDAALCRLRGDTQVAVLAVRLGNHPLPHRQRAELRAFSEARSCSRNPHAPAGLDVPATVAPSTPASATLCSPAPEPTPPPGTRVADKVEQIIEPAMRNHHQPSGAAWPGSPVPGAPPRRQAAPAPAPVFPGAAPGIPVSFLLTAGALRHARGSPAPGVLRRLRPARAFSWQRAYPPPPAWQEDGRRSGHGRFPCSRHPFDGPGTQLCPGGIATATPQAFTVASHPRLVRPGQEFPAP